MDDDYLEDDQGRPTADRPLHGERRPLVKPILAVIGLIAVVAVIFLTITWLRYST